jgi:hypothetical protein
MNKSRIILIAILALWLAACSTITSVADLAGNPTAQSSETQSVMVTGIPNLTVTHFAGRVTVREGETGRVSADLTKMSRLSNEASAREQLDEIVMTFTQQNNDVNLTVKGPENPATVSASPTADLSLTVPPGTNLVLTLGAGDITVEEPAGDVVVNSGAGIINVSLPDSASFQLKISGGPTRVNSDFPGVGGTGVATAIETTVGDNPDQSLTITLGAGEVNINQSP